jgi:hypothetical protein
VAKNNSARREEDCYKFQDVTVPHTAFTALQIICGIQGYSWPNQLNEKNAQSKVDNILLRNYCRPLYKR